MLGPGHLAPQFDPSVGVQLVPRYGDCTPFRGSDFQDQARSKGLISRALEAVREAPGGQVRAGLRWVAVLLLLVLLLVVQVRRLLLVQLLLQHPAGELTS